MSLRSTASHCARHFFLCIMVVSCSSQPTTNIAQADAATTPRGPFGNLPVELNLIGYQTDRGRFDRLNYEYVLPDERTVRYFVSKGFKTYRLTMAWERLQPKAFGPIPADKAAELDAFLDLADRYGIRVIADLHNYGRHNKIRLGDASLSVSALGDFWQKFAVRFKNRFYGFDLMNEPHDMPTPKTWPQAAQIAVDQIRKVDTRTIVYVEGDDWSNAGRWQQANANLDIRDPSNKLVYSAHIYFDKDTSGQYRNSSSTDGVPANIGVTRLRPFVNWLRTKGAKGHIGEFGIPYADRGWYAVLDQFLDEAARSQDVLTGVTYWGAGTWMDFYALTLQPAKGAVWQDRPQLRFLIKARNGS